MIIRNDLTEMPWLADISLGNPSDDGLLFDPEVQAQPNLFQVRWQIRMGV